MFRKKLVLCILSGLILSCADQKYSITEKSRCDGTLQSDEGDRVDSPYDSDGDGYFDGSNPDCEATYPPEQLDCDDNDAEVHPGNAEVECDNIDNDCNPETLDALDNDADGYDSCEDCADSDPDVNPGITETLCNGIDDDCNEDTVDAVDLDEDGYSNCEDCADSNADINPGAAEITCNDVDDDCNPDTLDNVDECNPTDPEPEDFSGTWIVTPSVSYACAFNYVTINVASINVTDANPTILFSSPTGTQPGNMSGTIDLDDSFSATNFISSGGMGCDETYTITGQFVSNSEFTATLTAEYFDASGIGGCFDCTNQTFTFTGVR